LFYPHQIVGIKSIELNFSVIYKYIEFN